MISRRTAILSGLAATLPSCRKARGDGYRGYAFVANEEGRAIAAVDLTAFAVAKHIRLPGAPTEVLAGSQGAVYALTPNEGVLYEIEAGKLAVKRSLPFGTAVTSMRPEPGGATMWVLAGKAGKLFRVDLASLRRTATISVGAELADFDVSQWTGLAAVTHPQTRSLSVVSLAQGSVVARATLGGEPGAVRFRSDGKAILVANRSQRLLTVLDSASARVVVHLPLALRPDQMCVHPDGGQVFLTGEGKDAVVVVYPYYVPEIAETVLAGSRPGAMAASAAHLFVTNPSAGDVTILSVERRKVVAVAQVGAEPGHVTVTPDGEYALVLNRKSGDMAVLRIPGIQPDRRKTAALFTMIPVGSRPVSAAVVGI